MSTPTYNAIILTKSRDWDDWVEQVKTTALSHDIWDQINPNLDLQDIEELEKPTRTSPTSLKAKRPKLKQVQTRFLRGNDDDQNDEDELSQSPSVRTNQKDVRTNEYEVEVEVIDESPLTIDERETLRYEMSVYDEDNRHYEKQTKALIAVRKEIQQTINRGARDITYQESHPYFIMVKLMQIYAPSEAVREADLRYKWEKVQNSKGREIETWLFEWETLYRKCVEAELPEMHNDRPVRAFLDSISAIDQGFANSWDIQIARGEEILFREIIAQFRIYYKNTSVRKKARTIQAVFTGATLQGRDQEGERSSEKSPEKRELPPCLCDGKHQWKECLYIMDFLRPPNWRIDTATLKKVQERLADPGKSFRKRKVEQVYIRTRDERQGGNGNTATRTNGKGPCTNKGENKFPSSYATIDYTKSKPDSTKSKQTLSFPMNFASYHTETINSTRINDNILRPIKPNVDCYTNSHTDDCTKVICNSPKGYNEKSTYLVQEEEKYAKYGLAKSTILDSGSTTHICNDRSRIYDYKEQRGSMLAGKAECQILGYGKVRLALSEPGAINEIVLHNVAYIPGFLTNIVSLDLMNEKDVHWDSRTRQLYHPNGVLCYTPRYFGQTVLQYVPIDASFFVQREQKAIELNTGSNEPNPRSYELQPQQATLFSSRKAKILKGTLQDWHERMGHLNYKAVAKLQQAQGVEITSKEASDHCETCRLAKAQRVISLIDWN